MSMELLRSHLFVVRYRPSQKLKAQGTVRTPKKKINEKAAAQCYEDVLAHTFPSTKRYKHCDITKPVTSHSSSKPELQHTRKSHDRPTDQWEGRAGNYGECGIEDGQWEGLLESKDLEDGKLFRKLLNQREFFCR